jgi:hypothetical protein
MIQLEYGVEGPFKTGFWRAKNTASGSTSKISGKQASMISMILSGYAFKPDFHPFDAFTQDSLDKGRPLLQEATAQKPAHIHLPGGEKSK